jgi:alginate O-acetyltransferase complex protein AlgI
LLWRFAIEYRLSDGARERSEPTGEIIGWFFAWMSAFMLFNSNEFLLVFLPVALVSFYLTRHWYGKHHGKHHGKWPAFAVLLLCSLFFYGWWDWRYLPLLLASLLVNLAVSGVLRKNPNRVILTLGIGFNLSLIAVFKYLGFIELNIESLTGSNLHWPTFVLPIGISFYTFQQIAFLVDSWRDAKSASAGKGAANTTDPLRYGLFVCFFPQLIAGPIVHHREMMEQFENPPANARIMRMAATGLAIFAIGLAKKTMLADPLGAFASPFFDRVAEGGEIHFFVAWSAALAYTFQIYFDFCGYSEMAIGLALLFGIKLPTNFNSPYKARSIIDFWRRWHMTLSRFLRDYLYMPLGGNRAGSWRRYRNLWIVMLIGGLWHGAAWTYVLWGGLHGSYLMINHGWRSLQQRGLLTVLEPLVKRIAWPLTFLAVVFAWVTFRSANVAVALQFYSAMMGLEGLSLPTEALPVLAYFHLQEAVRLFAENSRMDFYIGLLWTLAAALITFCAPGALQLLGKEKPTADYETVFGSFPERSLVPLFVAPLHRWGALAVGVMLYISLRLVNAAAETEFLYFQF